MGYLLLMPPQNPEPPCHRRQILWGRALRVLCIPLLVHSCGGTVPPDDRTESQAGLVNLFTGTAGRARDLNSGVDVGDTFPGAVTPFGMLQWSPDTIPCKTNYGAGYSYEDTQIRGFSLTHLSGVGCPIMMDVPFLPTTVPMVESPAVAKSYQVTPAYVPTFNHASEQAEPGYYRVVLDEGTDRAIDVALTATTRAGVGRFTFAPTATASVLMNAGGSAMANGDAVFHVDPARREVSGWVESGQFCYHRNRYTVYFAAEFDRAFSAYGTWTKQTVTPGATTAMDHADKPFHLRPLGPNSQVKDPPTSSNGAQAGAYVTFDTRSERTVQVRVAISFIDVDHARANLAAEMPAWTFDGIRTATAAAWDELLNLVQVSGGSLKDRRTFYTMLYHALLGPTVFSDATGEYLGMDGTVHSTAGRTQYTTFSGWDMYRSQVALLAILVPDRVSDMMQSLVTNARESGWLPRWSVAASHTDVQVGDPADPIIATANAYGATGFDRTAALAAMVKGATQAVPDPGLRHVQRQGLADYLTLGYVPHDGTERSSGASTSIFGNPFAVWGSAATTLEYATDDFALARFAADLGDSSTCETFKGRSDNWQRLFNSRSGYLQPRYADGAFLEPLDPASEEGWVEGNAAQYTWMVPHALARLAGAMGGPAATIARLDAFFSYLNVDEAPFAHLGNEPSANTPWMYDWLGRPDRTQQIVRRVLLTLFDDTPSGYPGNDDVGQMSAWYVLGALGLYPAIPGTDVLAIGSPLFPEVIINHPGGRITIMGHEAAPDRPFVTHLRVNGREHEQPWLFFREFRNGGELTFDLAATPDPSWASAAESAPPSFGEGYRDVCAPLTR
ncbi:MAG TPA: GH92 family glycosyl hydrolase [Mycobacterium sp.]|nr:GH92 family glycosyl hydrolase [Mycobacterium sp.]